MALEVSPRLTVITGDNGLGKSFLLDVTWWALTQTWAGNPALPQRDVQTASIRWAGSGLRAKGAPADYAAEYDWQSQRWRTEGTPDWTVGLVVYARVDGSFSVWDLARHQPLEVFDPERPLAYHFDRGSLWNGLTVGSRRPCEGLIRDWVNWQRSREPEFDRLRDVLRALSLPDEPIEPDKPIRVEFDDGFDTPAIKTRYDVVPLTHASAGVQRIAGLAYLLVWAWREHQIASRVLRRKPVRQMVVLIDEPETHLHPKWQRLILPSVLRAVSRLSGDSLPLSAQVMATTHSPLVLLSLEPSFESDKDALYDLAVQGNGTGEHVVLQHLPWRKLGHANAWLTSEAFSLAEPRSLPAEQLMERAANLLSAASVEKGEFRELDERLRETLSDTDPFWIRWRFVGEKKGWLT